MAINAAFDEELAAVDGTKSFSVTINTGTHTINEYTVSGYNITAGSDPAAEHAAVEALYSLGYRFWAPEYTTRPSSLPSGGVTIAQTERSMPYCQMFYNYGIKGQDPSGGTEAFARYCVLNGCNDERRPTGHAWGAWYLDDTAWFNDNPLLWSLSGSRLVLSLANSGHFETLAQRAALWISTRMNEENRYQWDAPDGDQLPSEQVWPWAARCAQILRTSYGITDAKLGVYAYAGHRTPVTGYDLTGLYGQIALGFSTAGFGNYPDLVAAWGDELDEISLRGYGDIAAQDGYRVPYAANRNLNFLNDYPSFKASGANGVRLETSGNWIKNLISHYTAVRVWAQGGTPSDVFDTALSEAVTSLFEGDSKVADLYELWDENTRPSNLLLARSFNIVNAMQADSWWRERFRQYMALQYQLVEFGDNRTYDGPYFHLVEESMRWAEAMFREDASVHAYVIQRQDAGVGQATNQGREDLEIEGPEVPHYYTYPRMPTEAEIDAVKVRLDRLTDYPDAAFPPDDIADWVEVSLPEPQGAADVGQTDAADGVQSIDTRYAARFIYSGPGDVTTEDTDTGADSVTTAYGSGLHEILVSGTKTTSWSGGTLYAVAEPFLWKDQTDSNVWWTYLPLTLRGWHLIEANTRLSIFDEEKRKDCGLRDGSLGVRPQTLVPGTVCVGNQTRGQFTLAGSTPTISPTRNTIVMPRALAIREGLL